uniref:Transmembrane protein 188 n=1 Tax=Ditylenchus dipsaci TaxID=166011 RepID=A0A915DGT7_9BILA
MEDATLAYEDMRFFERRLTEVISGMQPRVKKWRIALAVVFLSTVYSAYFWIIDPSIRFITLWESLLKHPLFTISLSMLLFLFLVCGVHKKVVAPKVIAVRCRSVLADFCLSCDENGKLILSDVEDGWLIPVPPIHSTTVAPLLQSLKESLDSTTEGISSQFAGNFSRQLETSTEAVISAIHSTATTIVGNFTRGIAPAQSFLDGFSENSTVANTSLEAQSTTKLWHIVFGVGKTESLAATTTTAAIADSAKSLVEEWGEPIVSRVLEAAAGAGSGSTEEQQGVTDSPSNRLVPSFTSSSTSIFTSTAKAVAHQLVQAVSNNNTLAQQGGNHHHFHQNYDYQNNTLLNSTNNSSTEGMLLVDEKGVALIPLEELLTMFLTALSVLFMVFGGAIPYVFQYVEIYQRKSAAGFSLLVCLALCVANILRILFWFGKHFETPLLVQSGVMIACMILMLEISVRMNKKTVPVAQRTSIWLLKNSAIGDHRWLNGRAAMDCESRPSALFSLGA